MANVLGIEVSGTTYDIEDTTARNTASSASSLATQASEDIETLQTTVNNISDSVDTIADDLQTVEDNIGDLADLETTAKTNLVEAINEIVPKVQSRPIITIKTVKSTSSNTSELTVSDLISAGVDDLAGSYLVTVHRITSNSITYFIGWIEADSREIPDCLFWKLAGNGTSLTLGNDSLVYSGGDSDTETVWIFQPIGDSYVDD